MNIVLSSAVTVLGIVFARELLMLAGAEGEMLELATSYLRIIFAGSLFVNFGQSSNMIMRGEGELVKAMLIMASSAVLNIVLAPAFILALRGQGLGVEGAACATVLSQAALAALMAWWFAKREKVARVHGVRFDGALFSEVLKVGFSAFFMQVLTLVQQAVIYRAAAEWAGRNGRSCSAPHCACRRSRSSPCGASARAFSRRRARTTARGATPASDASP